MADKNAKIKISGAKYNFTGRVSAKNKVHVKKLVEIVAISAKKAKKCRVREDRLADERQPSWVERPKRRRPGILRTKSTLLGGKFKFKFKIRDF